MPATPFNRKFETVAPVKVALRKSPKFTNLGEQPEGENPENDAEEELVVAAKWSWRRSHRR
jgi:hypothetical protein